MPSNSLESSSDVKSSTSHTNSTDSTAAYTTVEDTIDSIVASLTNKQSLVSSSQKLRRSPKLPLLPKFLRDLGQTTSALLGCKVPTLPGDNMGGVKNLMEKVVEKLQNDSPAQLLTKKCPTPIYSSINSVISAYIEKDSHNDEVVYLRTVRNHGNEEYDEEVDGNDLDGMDDDIVEARREEFDQVDKKKRAKSEEDAANNDKNAAFRAEISVQGRLIKRQKKVLAAQQALEEERNTAEWVAKEMVRLQGKIDKANREQDRKKEKEFDELTNEMLQLEEEIDAALACPDRSKRLKFNK